MTTDSREWLLLMFQLPARPTAARVRTWRQLQRLGALSVRNSGYALPLSDQAREDFEWLRADVVAAGGEAILFTARTIDPAVDAELTETFRAARATDFEGVRKAAAALARRVGRERPTSGERREIRALADRLVRIEGMSPIGDLDAERGRARDAVEALQQKSGGPMRSSTAAVQPVKAAAYHGRTWITRPRPGIDRFASAWLIRRFIDPRAKFAFAASADAAGRRRAITFDMYGGTFTHEGGGCTFETLVARFGVRAPAIDWLAGLVHALDLKLEADDIPESAAVGRLVEGLREIHTEDATLLGRGMEMIEALYRSRLAGSRSHAGSRPHRRGTPRARR